MSPGQWVWLLVRQQSRQNGEQNLTNCPCNNNVPRHALFVLTVCQLQQCHATQVCCHKQEQGLTSINLSTHTTTFSVLLRPHLLLHPVHGLQLLCAALKSPVPFTGLHLRALVFLRDDYVPHRQCITLLYAVYDGGASQSTQQHGWHDTWVEQRSAVEHEAASFGHDSKYIALYC